MLTTSQKQIILKSWIGDQDHPGIMEFFQLCRQDGESVQQVVEYLLYGFETGIQEYGEANIHGVLGSEVLAALKTGEFNHEISAIMGNN